MSRPPQASPAGSDSSCGRSSSSSTGRWARAAAFCSSPTSDDPGNSGLLLIDPEVLEATTAAALRHGWQVCTHAIGDKGNALVLDAYAGRAQGRPRSTRPPAEDRACPGRAARRTSQRFAELGVIASMQPSHASDDMRWADARLGPGRVDGAYAWRWFVDAGVPLAFGSDFPGRDRQPVLGDLCGDHAAGRRR